MNIYKCTYIATYISSTVDWNKSQKRLLTSIFFNEKQEELLATLCVTYQNIRPRRSTNIECFGTILCLFISIRPRREQPEEPNLNTKFVLYKKQQLLGVSAR